MTATPEVLDDEAVHGFFGLTYANYLVLHRTILQSMHPAWQREFVALLEEAREAARDVPGYDVEFWVRTREGNRFVPDLVPHYQRGRARVQLHPTRDEEGHRV